MSEPFESSASLVLRVEALRRVARGVLQIELVHPDGHALPPFTAGAHIDLKLPAGRVRSYSLANAPHERHRYVLGVKIDAAGRGGSRWIHEHLRIDTLLAVSTPVNHFELDESAANSVLIAGGIGVTPIVSMAARLATLGHPHTVHYSVRERSDAAFVAERRDVGIDPLASGLHLHVDAEQGGALLDIARIVAQAPADSHFYCCGPAPMLAAYEAATSGLPRHRVHLERFSSSIEIATEGGFEVLLARSQKAVAVTPGQSILDALRQTGIAVVASCEQGVCGTCETRVLEGTPEHRDLLLSETERARNDVMMICCSGSRSARLVLDL